MFKKSNRNFRTKRDENSDEDDNTGSSSSVITSDNSTKTNQVASTVKHIQISKTSTITTTSIDNNKTNTKVKGTVLSFDLEEEEDGETFKVKKSKESRRLAKEKKKEKKSQINESGNDLSQNKNKLTTNESSNSETPLIIINEHEEIILLNEEIKFKPLQKKTNQSSDSLLKTSSSKHAEKELDEEYNDDEEDYNEKLRSLREEMEGLNGDDDQYLDNESDEAKRSVKLYLKSGFIPDANMIHEAKKKRQLAARKEIKEKDYIPIENTIKYEESKSRLIREDDNDASEDEDRVSLNVLEQMNKERQTTRDNFLAYEQGSDAEGENDEDEEDVFERWEKEQIRKGVGQITQAAAILKSTGNTIALDKYSSYNDEPHPMDIESRNEIELSNLPKISFESIKDDLKKTLNSYDETYRSHKNEKQMIDENLENSKRTIEIITETKPNINEQYKFYQEMRAYVIDIVDCFNEKLSEIEKVETKWLNLLKQRVNKLMQRRQDDVKDQNTEFSIAFSAQAQNNIQKIIDASHQRRSNERESRYNKRRQARPINELHYEGMSSDDDENQSDINIFNQKKADVLSKVPELFNDVLEDFYDINIIKMKFNEWKTRYPDSYKDTYASLSLAKLYSPIIRLEIIDWNPLERNCKKLEDMNWFKVLKVYNETKEGNGEINNGNQDTDDDKMIIPIIIEKTIFYKLNQIIENLYDPFSTKQNENLISFFKYITTNYDMLNTKSKVIQKLFDSIIMRIRKTLDNDVFIPIFPKHCIDDKSSGPSKFFFRQFWSCVKLMNNILLWNNLLTNKVVQELTLDRLLVGYLMFALQFMELSMDTVNKIDYIVKKFPQNWFENLNKNQTLSQLNGLVGLLKRIVDNIDKNTQENNIESKQFKENLRQIRKIFVFVQAIDQAVELTNKFQIK